MKTRRSLPKNNIIFSSYIMNEKIKDHKEDNIYQKFSNYSNEKKTILKNDKINMLSLFFNKRVFNPLQIKTHSISCLKTPELSLSNNLFLSKDNNYKENKKEQTKIKNYSNNDKLIFNNSLEINKYPNDFLYIKYQYMLYKNIQYNYIYDKKYQYNSFSYNTNTFVFYQLKKFVDSFKNKISFFHKNRKKNCLSIIKQNFCFYSAIFGVYYYKNHPLYGFSPAFTKKQIDKFKKDNKDFCNFVTKTIQNGMKTKKNEKKKEELLNFSKNLHRMSYQIGRTSQIKKKSYFERKIQLVINAQKYVRGYLSRRYLINIINSIIILKSLQYIILIQKHFRRYYIYKKTRINLIIIQILQQRKEKCKIIKRKLKQFFIHNLIRKKRIFSTIIRYRYPRIITIQLRYKTHLYQKLSKEIIAYEKINYVLNYPFICSKVQLKLYRFTSQYSLNQTTTSTIDNEYYELYNFEKCPLRKIFVLYIKIGKIMPGTYRCQLIVDGDVTCDGRFPREEVNGKFYNVITFGMGKNDLVKSNLIKEKFIEEEQKDNHDYCYLIKNTLDLL